MHRTADSFISRFRTDSRSGKSAPIRDYWRRPVELKRLTLAPAERADLLVDFSGGPGRKIVLNNDAYTVMEFRVADKHLQKPARMPLSLRPVARIPEQQAVRTRLLTLTGPPDSDDPTAMSQPMLLNNSYWHDPVTENPALDTVEIWSLVNLTDDSHPIHLHLVRFQILDRRAFDIFTYLTIASSGTLTPPFRRSRTRPVGRTP